MKCPGTIEASSCRNRGTGIARLLLGLALVLVSTRAPGQEPASETVPPGEQALRKACSTCHRRPAPEILSKDTWPLILPLMNHFATEYLMKLEGPLVEGMSVEEQIQWFVERAPDRLPPPRPLAEPGGPVAFERQAVYLPGKKQAAVSNVRLVDLLPDPGPEIAFCDMVSGGVYVAKLGDLRPRLVATLENPAHVESGDFDGDGKMDLIVADLGAPLPSDDPTGRFVLLQNLGFMAFVPHVLLDNVGRAADARPVDLDGDGDLDIAAAAFGWRRLGSVYALENLTAPGGRLRFETHLVSDRVGAVSLETGFDLVGSEAPDIAVLFAQHHETLIVFDRFFAWKFQETPLFAAPHPNWGYDNLEAVDLDQDGDLDFLLANGDTLDDMYPFKPHHGVRWLENRGGDEWQPHEIGAFYGTHRSEAADLDGDGDLDVVASSFIPQRAQGHEPGEPPTLSIAWYENSSEGWKPWALELDHPLHATLTTVDIDSDGDTDIVVGTLEMVPAGPQPGPALEVYLNLGRGR